MDQQPDSNSSSELNDSSNQRDGSSPETGQTFIDGRRATSRWTTQPTFGVLIGLAALGALTLIYQLLIALGDEVVWVFAAIPFVCVIVAYWYWRPWFRQISDGRKSGEKSEISQNGWTVLTAIGLLYFVANMKRMLDPDRPLPPRPVHISGGANDQAANSFIHQRHATANYWQMTVADLHRSRFETPPDAESTQVAYERMSQELSQKVERARAASKMNVDSNLIEMVDRHLELDQRVLSHLAQIPQLMKQQQIPWGAESANESTTKWELIQAMLNAQPELWDKLPPETQKLISDTVALEQQQLLQYREIEIMQAVLRERYKGVPFTLPNIKL